MCSFFDHKQTLLKQFFDKLHQLGPGTRQSYFINELLWSNFGVTLGLASVIDRKMVLVKFV